jgi:hypothetical protein
MQEQNKSSVICWQHIVLTGALPICSMKVGAMAVVVGYYLLFNFCQL